MVCGVSQFCKCQNLSCLWLSQSFLEDRQTFGKDKNENKDEDKEKEKREMKMKIKNTLSDTWILGPPLRLQWLTYAENGSLQKA